VSLFFSSVYSSSKTLTFLILSWIYFDDFNSTSDKWHLNIIKLPVQLNTLNKTALILSTWTVGILFRTPHFSLNLPILVPSRIKTPRLILLNLLLLLQLSPPRITIIHQTYQTQRVNISQHMLHISSKGLRNLVSGVICVFKYFRGPVILRGIQIHTKGSSSVPFQDVPAKGFDTAKTLIAIRRCIQRNTASVVKSLDVKELQKVGSIGKTISGDTWRHNIRKFYTINEMKLLLWNQLRLQHS